MNEQRKLVDHIVPGDSANHQLTILVLDGPGAGGACHRYLIEGFDTESNASIKDEPPYSGIDFVFQNGPIPEVGVNGITHEAVAAILIDRLRSFQADKYACRENAIALTHFEEGLMWLQKRTVNRIRRGVEGTHKV